MPKLAGQTRIHHGVVNKSCFWELISYMAEIVEVWALNLRPDLNIIGLYPILKLPPQKALGDWKKSL